MIANDDQILGYFIGEECVHRKCTDRDEIADLTTDEILFEDDLRSGDTRFFCDRCKEEIKPN